VEPKSASTEISEVNLEAQQADRSVEKVEMPKAIAVVDKEKPIASPKSATKIAQVSTAPEPPIKKGTPPSESTKPIKLKPSGAYRIRVGASADLKEFDFSKIELLGSVEVKEWANKKIVFTGYYESLEVAQELIDLYLQKDYKNAVVVVMKDGRYRRVE